MSQPDYAAMREELNRLHRQLQAAPPEFKMGYQLTPASILNAYREGDISFDEAVKHLTQPISEVER